MLVHSYIYYELDTNIVSDHQWSEWATELANLQNKYPDISKKLSMLICSRIGMVAVVHLSIIDYQIL